MAGLQLGFSAGAFVPPASLPPSYAGSASGASISSRAYGIAAASAGGVRKTAGIGSATVGTLSTVALVWLWWTLPR